MQSKAKSTDQSKSTENRGARKAVCPHCDATEPSANLGKDFTFQARPDRPTDEFYCGCRGWN